MSICGTCYSKGFPYRLITSSSNSDIFKQNNTIHQWSMTPFENSSSTESSSSLQSRSTEQACGTCRDNVCALLPPSGSGFPCYEGTPDYAATCYKTDPLLKVSTFIIINQ